MRFQYRHPRVYDFAIRFFYPRALTEALIRVVGKGKTVLDIACGYGRVAGIIDPSNQYQGIDLNEYFVRYGQSLGRNLRVANIFDRKSYAPSDVVLLVDIVHHLEARTLPKLFDLVFANAREKVIVVEPAFVGVAKKYGLFGTALGLIFQYIDSDGFNRIIHWLTNEEYTLLFKDRFGSKNGDGFRYTHEIVGRHHLAVFERGG